MATSRNFDNTRLLDVNYGEEARRMSIRPSYGIASILMASTLFQPGFNEWQIEKRIFHQSTKVRIAWYHWWHCPNDQLMVRWFCHGRVEPKYEEERRAPKHCSSFGPKAFTHVPDTWIPSIFSEMEVEFSLIKAFFNGFPRKVVKIRRQRVQRSKRPRNLMSLPMGTAGRPSLWPALYPGCFTKLARDMRNWEYCSQNVLLFGDSFSW